MKLQYQLIRKYNRPIPRYTSYPTVPSWNNNLSEDDFKKHLKTQFLATNDQKGISVYIHLPFCESLCTYCACNTRITVNHSLEIPYIQALEKEFKMYLDVFQEKPIISELHLGGGTPTFFKPENLERLIKFILNNSVITDNVSFSFEAHPNNTSREHLRVLAELGFKRLSLGIQDFDPHVQNLINRHQSFEDVNRVMLEARELGYTSINFDLIYGLPDQHNESIRKTIDDVLLLKPDRIAFYSYAHVPWLKPGQRKYDESNLPKDDEKYALYELGRSMLEDAGYIEIGMDHFALGNDSLFTSMQNSILHRNFMGYTDKHTKLLIGLGVSAIGDMWTCFAQNEKKLEDYYRAIHQNKFPIMKGHLLSDDDLNRRTLILDLMCKLEADFKPELLNDTSISLVNEMLADGLITITNNKIQITYLGKSLLRNVCSIYDSYLSDACKSHEKYSMAV